MILVFNKIAFAYALKLISCSTIRIYLTPQQSIIMPKHIPLEYLVLWKLERDGGCGVDDIVEEKWRLRRRVFAGSSLLVFGLDGVSVRDVVGELVDRGFVVASNGRLMITEKGRKFLGLLRKEYGDVLDGLDGESDK